MVQDIITLSIVFLATAYAIFSIVKTLRTKSTNACGDNCSCGAKNEFNKLLKNKPGIPNGKLKIKNPSRNLS